MALNTLRIDRFISQQLNISRRSVRLLLAQRRVEVDGNKISDIGFIVDHFSHITVDDQVLQANTAYYIMLNKPTGVVSATTDKVHKTVIELLTGLDEEIKTQLHLVGRLDLNTSGLVLLTNDSRWSEALTSPVHKIPKQYTVTLQNQLSTEYISAFAQGMVFEYENITTLPAILTIISSHKAEVTLFEGKYHQIKRMFGRFQNKVISLHRHQVGGLALDNTLKEGEYRFLTQSEVEEIFIPI